MSDERRASEHRSLYTIPSSKSQQCHLSVIHQLPRINHRSSMNKNNAINEQTAVGNGRTDRG